MMCSHSAHIAERLLLSGHDPLLTVVDKLLGLLRRPDLKDHERSHYRSELIRLTRGFG